MPFNIDHNTRSRTWRELISELTDALIAHPELAREPACFSTDSAEALGDGGTEATIYYVRGLAESSDGDLVLTRGL